VEAEASAGVLSHPIGACRIGHLRSSLSVNAFRDHIGVLPGYLTKAFAGSDAIRSIPPTQESAGADCGLISAR